MAVGFWNLDGPPESTAVIAEDGRRLSYRDLRAAADRFGETIDGPKKTFGFVLCRNVPECLAAYLGALRSGHAVCLLDADLQPELLNGLLTAYTPDWIFSPDTRGSSEDYRGCEIPEGFLDRRTHNVADEPIAEELSLLLPTSGSTGSPKLVRLAYRNLEANARSIVSYLGLSASDRCITSLPMAYSYGLSVLHTHLLAGATVLMTTGSFLQRDFWTFARKHCPSSLAGVPYHYEIMLQMRMLNQDLPGLGTLTQAGGRLAPERIAQVANISATRGWRFVVMYGQTEATARISYVPPDRLSDKIGSIGIAIPNGCLKLDTDSQELLYSGPNVMLGYAEARADLGKGDEMNGRLRTGDLARQDDDGYFYIVGRLKRFLKIFGKRFNLDDMEGLLSRHLGSPVACFGADDRVCVAVDSADAQPEAALAMKSVLNLHPSSFRVLTLETLPRLANGKLDYQSLMKYVEA